MTELVRRCSVERVLPVKGAQQASLVYALIWRGNICV